MCGIAGLIRAGGLASPGDREIVEGMIGALRHRGPDGKGIWVDPSAGVALGHRRLAVIELSAAGAQPMTSASGRFVLVYNGEIYNHLEMRSALARSHEPVAWRGHSDTETLLACIDAWGIEETLKNSVGMFSFALWDRRDRTLTLARDRAGEKPLYYGWLDRAFVFGSELKALSAYPDFHPRIDRTVLAEYMRRGFIRAPNTIYSGVFKLPAASYLRLAFGGNAADAAPPSAYWSLKDVVERGVLTPFTGSDSEALAGLETHLRRSLNLQTIADVPLGAFLSGGVDSSLVVAMMQAQSSQPVRTFTIGFGEDSHNEAQHAQRVSRHLGTEHTELYVSANEAMMLIPSLPHLFDEPFGDNSAIPTILVSKLARRQVTVALSGDGGDELFGGYSRYGRTLRAWSLLRRIPRSLRHGAARSLNGIWGNRPTSQFAWKARRLALYLDAKSAAACYETNVSQFSGSTDLVVSSHRSGFVHEHIAPEFRPDNPYGGMMYSDFMSYLPDDILAKVDRASMSTSLECRVPMLDHHLIEFAWTLPFRMKVRGGRTKWLLRQLLQQYIPQELIDRPKMGFGMPVAEWLRGSLRDWAEDLLSEERLRREGYLNQKIVREMWQRHLARVSFEGDALWNVLMFQAWLPDRARAS